MSDEEVIKRRLLMDGDGTGDDRRLNTLIKNIIKFSNATGLSEDEYSSMLFRLMAQLSQCNQPAHRSVILQKTNERQLAEYQKMQEEIDVNIMKVKETIKEKKMKLAEARVLKGNRMHYDLLAQNIQKQPCRAETEEKVNVVRQELEVLKEERKSVEEVMDLRRKQFAVLSSSANQIRALLAQGKNEEAMNTSLDDVANSPGPEIMSE